MAKVYENQKVYLGHEDLTGATIRNCQLVYTGEPFALMDVTYENCSFAVEGQAAQVIHTLAGFYQAGPDFQANVEEIIKLITGQPSEMRIRERPPTN